MLLLDRNDAVDEFVRARCEVPGKWDTCQTIGLMKDGEIVAGIAFTDYTGANIVANIAIEPGSYVREFVRAGFRFAFLQLGCRRITALCAAQNARAHRLVESLGFQREGVIRHGLEEDDVVLYGILREQCRHLEEVH